MGVFNIDDNVSVEHLKRLKFNQITKNTWRYDWVDRGASSKNWWYSPKSLTYDIKRKMFRCNKKRYFVNDFSDFNIIFENLTS